jgi:hypothetical protein
MMFGQKWTRPRRWAAVAVLATCGALAVPQAGFAAAADPAGGATAARTGHTDHVGGTAMIDRTKTPHDRKTADGAKVGDRAKATDGAKTTDGVKTTGGADRAATVDGADRAVQADRAQSGRDRLTGRAGKADVGRQGKGGHAAADRAKTPKVAGAVDAPAAAAGGAVRAKRAGGDGAAASGARVSGCLETSNITVGAVWTDAAVDDHVTTNLVATISRPNGCSTVSALGFTITLPGSGTLWRAQGSDVSTCSSATITTSVGNSVLAVSDIALGTGMEDCTITFPVAADSSGTYPVAAAQFTSVAGLVVSQTTQTLTVNTAKPRVGAYLSPSHIVVMQSSTLHVTMSRTDQRAAAVSSGLGFRLDLPGGVTIGAGSPTNTCGGSVTAVAGAAALTLAAGSLTGYPAECDITVPITSSTAGTYNFDNTNVANPVGVQAAMTGGCAEHRRAEGECQPSLQVQLKPQTISFTAPANWSMSKHTVPLVATAESGLAVAFTSSTPAVCTVSGSTVTLVSPGACTVMADQAGNTTWDAATQVSHTFTVSAPIPPPSLVTATGGVSSLAVSWAAPGDITDVTGYTAIADPGPATCTTPSAAVTSCVMGGTAGVVYTVTVVTNHPLGDSAAAGPSNQAAPTAPVIPSTPPDTDLTLTTDKGLITTAAPGQDIVVIGTGFMAYSTATIVVYSAPIELGTVVTDGQGNFSKPVRVPPDLAVGRHQLVAAGIGPNGQPHSLKMAITVRDGSGLAMTGAPIAAMLQLGLTTVAGGGTLLLASRNRRRRQA